MSAILSADDLNDFISPGLACIKPIETLPKQQPDITSPWEVTTEDQINASSNPPPAQISLTDCLACSGCVTSAEAVLVSLQSHQEVLNILDAHPSLIVPVPPTVEDDAMLFIASVSPQARASLAATFNTTEERAGNMITQLLSGSEGLRSGGRYRSGFTWVVDTNALRSLCHTAVVEEVMGAVDHETGGKPKLPILASACPGWICYAEKTHPHILPHLSRVKSPQALTGILLKSVLSRILNISPEKIWHLAVMPCFDKKLEASREELTDTFWMPEKTEKTGVRDVDCVITAREVIMLADTRGISFSSLASTAITFTSFPDAALDSFLFSNCYRRAQSNFPDAGTSGGYALHILRERQAHINGSRIKIERGRNADVVEYSLIHGDKVLMRTARYFGFRNIQNLVRKLKPERKSRIPGAKQASAEGRRMKHMNGTVHGSSGIGEYAYIEVMACPGGCTNGGGQIKFDDIATMRGLSVNEKGGFAEQKYMLAQVDEAYFSSDSLSDDESEDHSIRKNDRPDQNVMEHWSHVANVSLDKLIFTTYRQVQSEVGKVKGSNDMDRVIGLASSLGGGW